MVLFLQFFIILLSSGHFQSSENEDLLENYKWKNRLIIINTDSEISKQQMAVFEGLDEEIKDRDLRFIRIVNEKVTIDGKTERGISIELLRQNLQLADEFACLLIGKDGGIKLRSTNLVEAKTIFELIDSMPMRQAEIKRKN